MSAAPVASPGTVLTSFDVDALLVQLRERLLGQARRAIALEAAARHRLAPPRQPFGGHDQVDV
jgi:hypothetical protein